MDLALLDELAASRPDLHLVMIGPVVKIEASRLPRRSNIHYLGGKTYQELPSYLAGWDVAMMPFARNDATRFISPTKTPEYLAAGKPVVSTSITDVVQPYGKQGLAWIADSAAEMSDAIDQALASDRYSRVAQADAFLADLSWDRTWDEMWQHVERAIQTRGALRSSGMQSSFAPGSAGQHVGRGKAGA
jgi:UDP-galactopyranose mutase